MSVCDRFTSGNKNFCNKQVCEKQNLIVLGAKCLVFVLFIVSDLTQLLFYFFGELAEPVTDNHFLSMLWCINASIYAANQLLSCGIVVQSLGEMRNLRISCCLIESRVCFTVESATGWMKLLGGFNQRSTLTCAQTATHCRAAIRPQMEPLQSQRLSAVFRREAANEFAPTL